MADGADDFVTCDVSRVRLWRTGTARRRRAAAAAAAAAGIQADGGPERTASNWFTVLPPRTVFHLPSGSGVICTVGCKSCGQDRSDRLGSEMSKRWMDQAEAQLLRTQRPKRATVSSSLVAGPPPRTAGLVAGRPAPLSDGICQRVGRTSVSEPRGARWRRPHGRSRLADHGEARRAAGVVAPEPEAPRGRAAVAARADAERRNG